MYRRLSMDTRWVKRRLFLNCWHRLERALLVRGARGEAWPVKPKTLLSLVSLNHHRSILGHSIAAATAGKSSP